MTEKEPEFILKNGPLIPIEVDEQPRDLANFGIAKFFIPFLGPADHVVSLDQFPSAKQAWVKLGNYGYELIISDTRGDVHRSSGKQGQGNHKRLLDLTGSETGVLISASYFNRVHSNKKANQLPCCTMSIFRYYEPIPVAA